MPSRIPPFVSPPIPAFSGRILCRLAEAIADEPDPWVRDDLKIARLTVLHAARGDAVSCAPHVLAAYEVLGLHPEKVWPAIQARRLALLGPLEAIGAPPKKPAQSVKLWSEKTSGARAINSRAAMQQGSPRTTISVPMAAPSIAAAYPNPDDSGSAKERDYFTVADIEKFFETCPPEILSRRFRHFLRGVWIASGRPHGRDIQFFKAVDDYRRACYYQSATTARLNLRAAEDLGLLEVAYRDARNNCHHIWIRPRTDRDKGLYRRVTTHRLPIALLLKWRELHRRGEHAEVTPFRKPSQPVPPPTPPAPSAPQPGKKVAEHRSNQRQSRKLTPREGPRLVNEMRRLMNGVKGHVGQDRLWVEYSPNDPRYRAPMSQENALLAACMNLAIPEASAREFLKLLPRDLAESEPEQGPS
jgi:hypothetical protein